MVVNGSGWGGRRRLLLRARRATRGEAPARRPTNDVRLRATVSRRSLWTGTSVAVPQGAPCASRGRPAPPRCAASAPSSTAGVTGSSPARAAGSRRCTARSAWTTSRDHHRVTSDEPRSPCPPRRAGDAESLSANVGDPRTRLKAVVNGCTASTLPPAGAGCGARRSARGREEVGVVVPARPAPPAPEARELARRLRPLPGARAGRVAAYRAFRAALPCGVPVAPVPNLWRDVHDLASLPAVHPHLVGAAGRCGLSGRRRQVKRSVALAVALTAREHRQSSRRG